ncbi:MAG: molybdopterin-dependent oxidoreductase [Acidobacteria bacterium]|nr:molybdopterin-dependent oxidoreductase [Acidobacteriota bacterium]
MKHGLLLFTLLLIVSAPVFAQTAPPLRVRAGERDVHLLAADLARLPRRTVVTADGGRTIQFEGVRLADLLAQAGVTFGQTLRGPRLATYVLARAGDGYQVVFALPEIDPDFAADEVIVADRQDGAPLAAGEGPLRVVAAGDKRHARWVRGVTALEIHSATEQP